MKRADRFKFTLVAATVSLLFCNSLYDPARGADSASVVADGVVLMGSGKNNFVRPSDNLIYLKGGTLFVTVKEPSSGVTIATKYGIVKVPRDAYVMVSLSGDRFVAQALKVGSSKVRVALSQRSFPEVKDRVVDLNEKEEVSATAKESLAVTDSGVVPAPRVSATRAPNEAAGAPQDASAMQQARQNAQPTIIQAAPNPGSGAMNVATMTAAGLAATGGILSIVGASRQMQNTRYMNGLRDMAYMQPYLNTSNWKIPDIKNTNSNTLNEKDKGKPKPDDSAKSDDKDKLDLNKAEEAARNAAKKAEEEAKAGDKKADDPKDTGKDDGKDDDKKAGAQKDDDNDDDQKTSAKADDKDDDDKASAKSPEEQEKDDQAQADNLSDDKQLADADTDKDGVPDSNDDDGAFPDDGGGGSNGADSGGSDDGGASDAGGADDGN